MLVHGSDGRDITLCVTSLAQIILNPDCRTVRGFEALIEREWLQVGSTNSYRFERIVNIILKCMKMLNIFRTILLFHRLVIRFTQEWQRDLPNTINYLFFLHLVDKRIQPQAAVNAICVFVHNFFSDIFLCK